MSTEISPLNQQKLKEFIRDIPDFPKKGILFKDITPLLKDKDAFRLAVDLLAKMFEGQGIEHVVGIESRGFIFGASVAYRLNAGFVPIRKKGKLPYLTESIPYQLEYGEDILEVHQDCVRKGAKVVIVDDLLATGGTAGAVVKLIEKVGGVVSGVAFVIELTFLNGRSKIQGYPIRTLLQY